MSNPLRKERACYQAAHESYIHSVPAPRKIIKRRKVKAKKRNLAALFFAALLMGLYGYFICTYNFHHYFEPLFLNRFLNRNIKLDVESYIQPSLEYTKNSYFLDKYIFAPVAPKNRQMTDIQILKEMSGTKNKLQELFKKYPNLEPGVFVFEYSTGAGFEINGNTPFASASIIKIPIAFELMRVLDETSKTDSPVSLKDKKVFSEDFRTSGSGHLQYTQGDVEYTLNHLASIMISESDNSATNMILHEIGGVDGFNKATRNLGLKVTSMGNWLPDLEGTNKITPREISTILYNIDNPNYIKPQYKPILKDYLLSTKNVHLLKEKLPDSALIYHKTGNIGTMLGDSGIVYAQNGRKYIVTILVKRPHNDYRARTLIQDASLLIYNDILAL